MEICQVCNSSAATCDVFVFIPGRDDQGIHNTHTIGRVCNACSVLVARGEIKLPKPENSLTLAELIGNI